MLLKDLKNIELELLLLEQRKFEMSFNDYIVMESYLDDVGEITNRYIQYLNDYNEYITNVNLEERKTKIEKKNEELLNTDIDIDIDDAKKILEKYKE